MGQNLETIRSFGKGDDGGEGETEFLSLWHLCTPQPLTHRVSSYYLAVVVLATAVGGGERGRALLQVPRLASTLGRAGDGDGVDGVGVTIAGAVVSAAPTVA